MDDLIAFLRARLDEREEWAETVHRRICDTLDNTYWGTTDPCNCAEPEWQLADVAAACAGQARALRGQQFAPRA